MNIKMVKILSVKYTSKHLQEVIKKLPTAFVS